jgi:LEA14-like dessication related protein|tara:strand:- start:2227 stop:2736 length:510 start_codon:yes stop_codon:yes gene_type:complete
MAHFIHRLIQLTALCALLSACAGITYHAEPPQISLNNLRLVDAQLFEQHYELSLRVQNTNDTPLYIKGLSYQLTINGSEFAHGVSQHAIDIAPYAEQLVKVSLIGNTLGVIQQIQQVTQANQQTVHFSLSGNISMGAINFATPLYSVPFRKEGVLNLAKLMPITGTKQR